MTELYRYNPHALAPHNVEARAAAVARGERPDWDPAMTDATVSPPVAIVPTAAGLSVAVTSTPSSKPGGSP